MKEWARTSICLRFVCRARGCGSKVVLIYCMNKAFQHHHSMIGRSHPKALRDDSHKPNHGRRNSRKSLAASQLTEEFAAINRFGDRFGFRLGFLCSLLSLRSLGFLLLALNTRLTLAVLAKAHFSGLQVAELPRRSFGSFSY